MKISKLLISALAAITVFACSKDNTDSNSGKGTEGEATLVVKVQGNPQSRAEGTPIPGEPAENAIHKIEFFVFNSDGTPDATYDYFSPTSFNGSTSFLVTAGTGKQLLVAVNQGIGQQVGSNIATVRKLINEREMWNATENNAQTAPAAGVGYEMAGETTFSVLTGETNPVSVIVDRLVSRIRNVNVNGGGTELSGSSIDAINNSQDFLKELFDATATGTISVSNLKWEFNGYVVMNGGNASYAFDNDIDNPSWVAHTDVEWFKTTYTDNNRTTISKVYAGSGTGDQFLPASHTGEVFVYETKPVLIPSTEPGGAPYLDPDQTISLLVKGTFSCDEPQYNDAVRYWRVNMIRDDNYTLYRNCVYDISLKNIMTPGYGTPGEAEDEKPIPTDQSSIEVDVIPSPWGFKTQDVDL